MGRIGGMALALLCLAAPLRAQDGPARIGGSAIAHEGGDVSVELALSRAVPWRVAMPDPRHLALDLRGVAWEDADLAALLEGAGQALEGDDGWARLLIDLGGPFRVTEAGMAADGAGGARLSLRLEPAGEPPAEAAPQATVADGRLVVAIDPGHGGRDPGAEHGGLRESGLMLALALELAQALERAGMVPVLTRSEDVFVPLSGRTTAARAAGADVLVSLHADALEEGSATGASVYTLSAQAEGEASGRMVERHGRGDLVQGLDLAGADDAVATALLDLARQDTGPASRRLAEAVVAGLGRTGARVNARPRREAPLAVLDAADFPSVLVEVGFLSNPEDRARLSSPEGRAPLVAGLLLGLASGRAGESAGERAGPGPSP